MSAEAIANRLLMTGTPVTYANALELARRNPREGVSPERAAAQAVNLVKT